MLLVSFTKVKHGEERQAEGERRSQTGLASLQAPASASTWRLCESPPFICLLAQLAPVIFPAHAQHRIMISGRKNVSIKRRNPGGTVKGAPLPPPTPPLLLCLRFFPGRYYAS